MKQSDADDRPNLNSGQEWSEIDLFDLANCVRLNNPIEEIADFLCRSRREVREKLAELERSMTMSSPASARRLIRRCAKW
jgi:hypothetical protein